MILPTPPIDPAALDALLQQVMAVLRDHLALLPAAAAGETAKGVAKAVGSDIWTKVKGWLTSAGKEEAAAALEAAPTHPAKQKKFEGELYELLEAHPDFVRELQSLLTQAAPQLHASQSGTGNITVQITGSNVNNRIG